MAIDVDSSHDISKEGLSITDDAGNVLYYLSSGSGDPSGSSAPINTWYFRTSNQLMYYKFGAGDNDWRQIRAADMTAQDQEDVTVSLQTLLDSISGGGGSGVSQTIIFGNGGNRSANSYLSNQDVVSSVIGVPVGLTNAKLRSFFLDNENIRSGDIKVFADGVLIYTATLVAQKKLTITGLDISIPLNAEISVQTLVSLKNCKVVLNINGDSA